MRHWWQRLPGHPVHPVVRVARLGQHRSIGKRRHEEELRAGRIVHLDASTIRFLTERAVIDEDGNTDLSATLETILARYSFLIRQAERSVKERYKGSLEAILRHVPAHPKVSSYQFAAASIYLILQDALADGDLEVGNPIVESFHQAIVTSPTPALDANVLLDLVGRQGSDPASRRRNKVEIALQKQRRRARMLQELDELIRENATEPAEPEPARPNERSV